MPLWAFFILDIYLYFLALKTLHRGKQGERRVFRTSRWIPVSERLPEETGKCIVTAFDGTKNRTTYADAITMQVEHEEYVSLEDLTSKIEELAEIMRQGNCNADMMMLPSQSAASAESLMRKAIDILEELTGEEWNFTYITY